MHAYAHDLWLPLHWFDVFLQAVTRFPHHPCWQTIRMKVADVKFRERKVKDVVVLALPTRF